MCREYGTPSSESLPPNQWIDMVQCFNVIFHGFDSFYQNHPLANIQNAIENGPVEIVDPHIPIQKIVIFHTSVSSPAGN